jgi:hypothetical protein
MCFRFAVGFARRFFAQLQTAIYNRGAPVSTPMLTHPLAPVMQWIVPGMWWP